MQQAFYFHSAAILVFTGAFASQNVTGPPSWSCNSEAWLEGASCASGSADVVSFLQVDSSTVMDKQLSQSAARTRANALKPVAWLHVPKTGSTFLNTLIHNPTFCPYTPKDLFLPIAGPNSHPLEEFWPEFNEEVNCPGVSKTYPLNTATHAPIGAVYADNVGHWVTILRQPEQRLISDYNHGNYVANGAVGMSAKQFAVAHQGHTVNLLTLAVDLSFWNMNIPIFNIPSDTQDDLAVQRLRDGFAFVGLSEEWDLSICLFHAMFGGTCASKEFQDMRLGVNRTNHEPYDTSVLEGFIDVHDAKVYEEGVRMFENSMKQYQLSRSTCWSFCLSG